MGTTLLAIVDHASGVPSGEITKFVAALDRQLSEDVAPRWGRYVSPYAAKPGAVLDPKTWVLNLWRNPRDARDAGALGYHETFGKDCVPVGHVFTELSVKDGSTWTSVADHEALEMVGDPEINLEVVRVRSATLVELWPRELCDAVQGLTYDRDGVNLSNFVLPEYFVEGADGPFDHLGKLKHPFAIDPSGYSSIRSIAHGKVTQHDIYGPRYAEWRKSKREYSRKSTRFRW